MKIIFSRKGFDSSYGGSPSPILYGKLLSLPIPAIDGHGISYNDVMVDSRMTFKDVMNVLDIQPKLSGKLHTNKLCHLDPDLRYSTKDRLPGWKPLFGQAGTSKTHLVENEKVEPGDVFLFFGTFQNTVFVDKKIQFDKDYPRHVIWGFMVIGEIWDIGKVGTDTFKKENPDKVWAFDHPHLADPDYGSHNALFVAADKFGAKSKGSGTFLYSDKLALTKLGYPKTVWELPSFFNPKEVDITHHLDEKRYHYQPDGKIRLQTVSIGQEFVVKAKTTAAEKKLVKWVTEVIEGSETFE
jgi:hypothetical protein